jgi:hypothetical protein
MTDEKFKRAVQLKEELSNLMTLDKILLKACTKGYKLAVIDTMHYDIIEDVKISEDLVRGFRTVLAPELIKRDKEFDEL